MAAEAPIAPIHDKDDTSISHLSLCITAGSTLCMWSGTPSSETNGQIVLSLAPGASVIIGRQDGGETEYLDPNYRPTQIMPGTGQAVVSSNPEDTYVSRGHFMLRGSTQGIIFVNGVPKRGGGIRPPMNWTQMLSPSHRLFKEGEEFLIERGAFLQIHLPNGTVIMIGAE